MHRELKSGVLLRRTCAYCENRCDGVSAVIAATARCSAVKERFTQS